MKARFISLEGLSGVGKSTVSILLAERIGADFVGTIPQAFNELRKMIDGSEITNINARFLFYFAAVLEGEKSIKTILESNRTVVVESYFYRTLAFHRGMGSDLEVSIPPTALMPDRIFQLTCEESMRRQRRQSRNKYETYWDRKAEQNTENILREYQKLYMETIDTTYLSLNQVVENIVDRLDRKGG